MRHGRGLAISGVVAAAHALALCAAGGEMDEVDRLIAGPTLRAVRTDEARRIAVLEKAARAVVCIFPDRERSSGGSGVLISADGYGLTNFHVAGGFVETRRGYGGLSDGRLYPLRLVGVDPGGDVALFKLEGQDRAEAGPAAFDFAPLGDSDALEVGQWVAVLGNPFTLAEDYTPTVTLGVISGLHRYQEGQGNLLEYADCIQVSTSINPGNSGGPLFDLEGRVIGINGRASFAEERGRVNVGLGYAVSINQIKRFLPGLRAGRLCSHGTLGIMVRRVGPSLIIGAIQGLSPAERAGLQLGDELLEVAGRPLRTPNQYNNLLATLPANWPVRVKVRRPPPLDGAGHPGREIDAVARLEPLPLRTPLVYTVDLEHNHAQIAWLLDEFEQRNSMRVSDRLSAGRGALTWSGQARDDAAAARPFWVTVTPPFDVTGGAAAGVRAGGLPEVIAREWAGLSVPLVSRPAIGLGWEMLDGDEVAGEVVYVVERRLSDGQRVRWKFGLTTAVLRQVTFSQGDEAEAIVWTPGEIATWGELRWPQTWLRRDRAGAELSLEIAAYVAEPPAEPSRERRKP